jgi:hypothetical protein
MSQDTQMFLKALALYHGLPNIYQARFTAEYQRKNRDKKMTTTDRVSLSDMLKVQTPDYTLESR